MQRQEPLQTASASNLEDLRALAHAYTQPLIRYFIRRGVPAESAEDCAQEVFLRPAKMTGPAIENPQAE
jgi:DNA-directed RNA polymerase specialized sigma24 family protein